MIPLIVIYCGHSCNIIGIETKQQFLKRERKIEKASKVLLHTVSWLEVQYCVLSPCVSWTTCLIKPRWNPLSLTGSPSPKTGISLLLPNMPSSWNLIKPMTDHSSLVQKSAGIPCKLMYSWPFSWTAFPIKLSTYWVVFRPPFCWYSKSE